MQAHEVRPGYLEITQLEEQLFAVIWKQPVRDGRSAVAGLGLKPVFPPGCETVDEPGVSRRPGVLIQSFQLRCSAGLAGQTLAVAGLQQTITDVFVRLTDTAGQTTHLRLTATEPAGQFTGGGSALSAYFSLGVEHLLFGFDHLLFVLGLVLLISGWKMLLATVTAFTLAHSITLGCSIFGLLSLPSAPVEASIALSVLFVASELMRRPQARSPLASRHPYAIALGFGLLHGFGFAGVLANIGLPKGDALWALGLFNIGLECGQLLVVALVLAARHLTARSARISAVTGRWKNVPAIGIGIAAAWWLAERIAVIAG